MDVKEYIRNFDIEFGLDRAGLEAIADGFKKAMQDGLAKRPSPLKMLPSYIGEPSGTEKGSSLAIDFGGTNVRIIQVSLDGAGGAKIEKILKFPLKAKDGSYNHVSPESRAEDLFDYIALKISEIAPAGRPLALGHTFSFPCDQKGINSAFLIHWTKEICTQGVEGRDVTVLLSEALKRKGVGQAVPAAVINDTVGTLLAASYADRCVDIASICGTGHNSCYLEPAHPLTGKPMVVNMESGNFDGAPQTKIDEEIDASSEMPGKQKLEKMASGYYLGEIFRLALKRAAQDGMLPASPALSEKFSARTEDMAAIASDSGSLQATASFAETRLGMPGLSREALGAMKAMSDAIALRSARLVAASFSGVVKYVDPGLTRPHTIAIDGSLYEKMPGYHDNIAKALSEVLGEGAKVKTALAKDGSGIGAAIAAAVASRG